MQRIKKPDIIKKTGTSSDVKKRGFLSLQKRGYIRLAMLATLAFFLPFLITIFSSSRVFLNSGQAGDGEVLGLEESVCKPHDVCGDVGEGGCVAREECLENEFVCEGKVEEGEEQTEKLCCDRGRCVECNPCKDGYQEERNECEEVELSCESKDCKGDVCGESQKTCYPSRYKITYNPGEGGKCPNPEEVCPNSINKTPECSKDGNIVKNYELMKGTCEEFNKETGVCNKVESDLEIDIIWQENELPKLMNLDLGGGLTRNQTRALPTPSISSVSPTSKVFLGGGSMTINVSNIVDVSLFSQISAGNYHTCGLKDGWVYCWGSNSSGQLGNGTTTSSNVPVAISRGAIPTGATITELSAGATHTCVLASNRAYCWGANGGGQLGDNSTTPRTTPVATNRGDLPTGKGFYGISAGNAHTCALETASIIEGGGGPILTVSVVRAYCWGTGSFGRLGNGGTTNALVPSGVSQGAVPAGTTFSQISAGGAHTCALGSNSKVYCWGINSTGQLGDNSTTQRNTPVPVTSGFQGLPASYTATNVSVGASSDHSCVRLQGVSNLGVYCWGNNGNGQLGNGTTTMSQVAVAVYQGAIPVGVTLDSVNVGSSHTCALGTNDKGYCWGNGANGRLGNGSTTQSTTPVAVSAGVIPSGDIRDISSGSSHTCALGITGKGYCWGLNSSGQLGDNTTTQRTTPVAVFIQNADMYEIKIGNNTLTQSVSVGSTSITVSPIPAHVAGAVTINIKRLFDNVSSNSVNFTYTNLPAPDITNITPSTITGSGGTTINLAGTNFLHYGPMNIFSSISAGGYHTCGVGSDGKGYCWGYNYYGQLGNGGTTQSTTPVAVSQGAMPAGVTLSSISAGNYHTCGVGSDGKGYCWGYNYYGQLGNGGTTQSTTPVAVSQGAMPAGATFLNISAGSQHTCGVGSDGKGYCWGYNYYGQLGNGSTTDSNVPVLVSQGAMPAGVTLSSISAGNYHTCGLGRDDKGYCWGQGTYGQLGNGGTTQSTTPVAVSQGAMPAGATFLNISAGGSHTCAAITYLSGMVWKDQVYCWGNNVNGQLGDGTTTQRTTPILVGMFSYVSTGGSHTCAIVNNNQAKCWGSGTNGQLGDGSSTQQTSPVEVSQGAIPAGVTLQSISPGNQHTCAIGSDNKGYCWGSNSNGRLGNDSTTNHPTMSYVLQKGLSPTIDFGTTPAMSTTYTSTSSMSAVSPSLSTTGTLAVKLTNPDGQYATYNITVQSAPTEPLNLTATAGNKQVTLNWTAPSSNGGASITDYIIQYSTNGSTWTTFDDGVSTTTSAIVTGLTNGQQYYFRVAAVNSVGQGPYSSNVTATPVNQPPTFTSISNNSPVNPGANITWSTVASDPDSSQVKLVVCKTQGVTGTACSGGASDTWCTSSLVSSNPSCSHSVPSPFTAGTYNAYAYIFDGDDAAATGTTQGSNSLFDVNSVAPIVTSVSVNGGQSITPEESTTVDVDITATVTSDNSCQSISDVKAYLYRSGVGYSNCSSSSNADNNKCYTEISCSVNTGTCTGPTDKTASYTCTASVWYYADPTDTQTQYDSQNWLATVKATVGTVSGTAQSSGVEMNSLVAFSVTEALNYGTLIINQTTDPLDKIVVTTATGNVGLNQNHSGENMGMCVDYPTCTVGTPIGLSHQKYSTSQGSSYTDSSVSKPLTDTPTLVELRVPKVTSIPISRNTWWGVSIPINTRPGAYEGRNRIEAVKSASTYWPE